MVDASVASARCFPDEASACANRVPVALKGQAPVVPDPWGLEVSGALVVGERRKGWKQPEILPGGA